MWLVTNATKIEEAVSTVGFFSHNSSVLRMDCIKKKNNSCLLCTIIKKLRSIIFLLFQLQNLSLIKTNRKWAFLAREQTGENYE